MVTPTQNDERRATASPFGLMADLGAALAAQLGMPRILIGRHLGPGVTNETARAAVIRGRRELTVRRIDLSAVRPQRADAPATAGPVAPAVRPQASPDSIEALLTWAQTGPQHAAQLAARIRILLGELEHVQLARREDNAKQKVRRDVRRQTIPVGADDLAQRRAYFAKVRTWARANGHRAPENRIVPTTTIRAYEAAHAAQPQRPTDEGDPHRPG